MSQQPSTLNASGWTLAVGASSSASATSEGADVYVIHKAKPSTDPAVASSPPSRAHRRRARAREAAHIALHGLLEGYFGAAATLGRGVPPVLRWEVPTPGCSAVPRRSRAPHGGFADGAHLCRPARPDRPCRRRSRLSPTRHQLTPLTSDHVHPAADGTGLLTRSVGGDAELQMDYLEDACERPTAISY